MVLNTRKVTIDDLVSISKPEVFLEKAQDHLRWMRNVTTDRISKIDKIARQKFRGQSGYQKIHKFFKNLLNQIQSGARSVLKAIAVAKKQTFVPVRISKNRGIVRRDPRVHFAY